jgi:hypothetical protein
MMDTDLVIAAQNRAPRGEARYVERASPGTAPNSKIITAPPLTPEAFVASALGGTLRADDAAGIRQLATVVHEEAPRAGEFVRLSGQDTKG